MPKITLRRGMWIGVALLSVVVLPISGYVLTRPSVDTPPRVIRPSKYNLPGELKRAEASPEWAELTKLLAKENRPLTPAGMERAGQLSTHSNFIIRMTALGVLALAPDELKPAAIALVVPHLKEENDFVRTKAMDVLGELGAKQYVPDLVAFLDSSDSNDRSAARRALGRLGHPVQ